MRTLRTLALALPLWLPAGPAWGWVELAFQGGQRTGSVLLLQAINLDIQSGGTTVTLDEAPQTLKGSTSTFSLLLDPFPIPVSFGAYVESFRDAQIVGAVFGPQLKAWLPLGRVALFADLRVISDGGYLFQLDDAEINMTVGTQTQSQPLVSNGNGDILYRTKGTLFGAGIGYSPTGWLQLSLEAGAGQETLHMDVDGNDSMGLESSLGKEQEFKSTFVQGGLSLRI